MIYSQLILTFLVFLIPEYQLYSLTALLISLFFQLFKNLKSKKDIRTSIIKLEAFTNGEFGKRLFSESTELQSLFISINQLLEKYQLHEQEIRSRNKQMINRLAHISHDLRTPLTSLLGYIDALQDDIYKAETERKKALSTLQDKARRIKSYTENFFHLSQLENPDNTLEFIIDDVTELLRESIIELMPLIEKAGFKVDLTIPDQIIQLKMYRHSLKRVFINLIDNSLKYAIDKRYIGVELIQDKNHVQIIFSDKGSGIPAKTWSQVQNQAQSIDSGGIGLIIIKKIIDYHDGIIAQKDHNGLHQMIISLPR